MDKGTKNLLIVTGIAAATASAVYAALSFASSKLFKGADDVEFDPEDTGMSLNDDEDDEGDDD